jgi:hypothetical protein
MIFGAEDSFLKKILLRGAIIDCFEPIFGFLMQFWFQKHSSDTWNRIGMFSELSGRSATVFFFQDFPLLQIFLCDIKMALNSF